MLEALLSEKDTQLSLIWINAAHLPSSPSRGRVGGRKKERTLNLASL